MLLEKLGLFLIEIGCCHVLRYTGLNEVSSLIVGCEPSLFSVSGERKTWQGGGRGPGGAPGPGAAAAGGARGREQMSFTNLRRRGRRSFVGALISGPPAFPQTLARGPGAHEKDEVKQRKWTKEAGFFF